MTEEERPGDVRDLVKRMLDAAEFYGDLIEKTAHHPMCWKIHTVCSLRRILDALDGEEQ